MNLKRKDDIRERENINATITDSCLAPGTKTELLEIFDVRKSKKKFIRFVEEYSVGFFRGGSHKARHTRIGRPDLERVLKTIYDARSQYLHRGESMYLSTVIKGAGKWDTDPVLEK